MKHFPLIKNLLKKFAPGRISRWKHNIISNPPPANLRGIPSIADKPVQPKSDIGGIGEGLAASELQRRGYRVLDRNFRTKVGEIDIIAKKGGELYFFEVKSGTSRRIDPIDRIDNRKVKKLVQVTELYLLKRFRNGKYPPVHISAISVRVDGEMVDYMFFDDINLDY